jgi:hypothetical protein
MTGEAIKHLALGFVGRAIADQGALGGVLPASLPGPDSPSSPLSHFFFFPGFGTGQAERAAVCFGGLVAFYRRTNRGRGSIYLSFAVGKESVLVHIRRKNIPKGTANWRALLQALEFEREPSTQHRPVGVANLDR